MTTPQNNGNGKEGLLVALVVPWWIVAKDDPLIGAMIDRARAVHLRLQIREVLDERKRAKKTNGGASTLPQLALEVDVTDKTVGNWNRGETEPNQRYILALSTVLDRDVRDLTPTTLEWIARVTAYLTDSEIVPGVIPLPALIYAQHRLGVKIPAVGTFSLDNLFGDETITSRVIAPLQQIDSEIVLTPEEVQRIVMETAEQLESILVNCKSKNGIAVRHQAFKSRYRGPGRGDPGRPV